MPAHGVSTSSSRIWVSGSLRLRATAAARATTADRRWRFRHAPPPPWGRSPVTSAAPPVASAPGWSSSGPGSRCRAGPRHAGRCRTCSLPDLSFAPDGCSLPDLSLPDLSSAGLVAAVGRCAVAARPVAPGPVALAVLSLALGWSSRPRWSLPACRCPRLVLSARCRGASPGRLVAGSGRLRRTGVEVRAAPATCASWSARSRAAGRLLLGGSDRSRLVLGCAPSARPSRRRTSAGAPTEPTRLGTADHRTGRP